MKKLYELLKDLEEFEESKRKGEKMFITSLDVFTAKDFYRQLYKVEQIKEQIRDIQSSVGLP